MRWSVSCEAFSYFIAKYHKRRKLIRVCVSTPIAWQYRLTPNNGDSYVATALAKNPSWFCILTGKLVQLFIWLWNCDRFLVALARTFLFSLFFRPSQPQFLLPRFSLPSWWIIYFVWKTRVRFKNQFWFLGFSSSFVFRFLGENID